MNKSTQQELVVPFPRPTQNVYRGYRTARAPDMFPTSIRFTDADHEFIDKQASATGMSFGEFVRWCSYYAAMEVSKLEYIKGFHVNSTPKQKEVDYSEYE